MKNLVPSRQSMWERTADEEYDIIILGGGITGAGMARDAILRGLSVALFEQGDFGSGTSMQTSKMMHGGLRYLQNYEFRLVRSAALERGLHTKLAPHMVHPFPFLVPVYKWSKEPPILLRLGLVLYDLLGIPRSIGRHKWLSRKKLVEKMSLLENPDLRSGAMYYDTTVDDTRMALTNILSAASSGAVTLNYTRVEAWRKNDDGVEVDVKRQDTGETRTIKGRSLIICGGPWSQKAEELGEDFKPRVRLRTTSGSHVILKKRLGTYACLLVNDDGRPIFLIPRDGYDIAGTTDNDYSDDPSTIKPSLEDIDYLISACNKLFPTANYTHDDVVASFAGLRPLIYKAGVDETKVSREHEIFIDPDGIFTVAGGKLTTYRQMAKQTIDKLLKSFGLSKRQYPCITDRLPLFGGEMDDWEEFLASETKRLEETYKISNHTANTLLRMYGSEIEFFETILQEHGTALLQEGRQWLEAQVIYACRVELAVTTIDMIRRRMPLALEAGNGLDLLDRIAEIMQQELGWSAETKDKMRHECIDYIQNFIAVV